MASAVVFSLNVVQKFTYAVTSCLDRCINFSSTNQPMSTCMLCVVVLCVVICNVLNCTQFNVFFEYSQNCDSDYHSDETGFDMFSLSYRFYYGENLGAYLLLRHDLSFLILSPKNSLTAIHG